MNGMITTKEYSDLSDPISRMKAYTVAGVVMATTTKEKYRSSGKWKESSFNGLWRKEKHCPFLK